MDLLCHPMFGNIYSSWFVECAAHSGVQAAGGSMLFIHDANLSPCYANLHSLHSDEILG